MNERTALSAEHLVKKFKVSKKQQKINKSDVKEITAVNDLSVELNKGEIYCLLGTNGAGKTTTLRMLSTLLRPTEGDIHIGEDSLWKDENKSRSKIGFLTGELKLDDAYTPEYLFSYFGKLYKLSDEKIKERRDELFAEFGIDKYAEVMVKDLSTGMKQKVSIAIALIHDPEIIIFDEPTNGLDIIASREVVNILKQQKERGKCVIVSTHIFDIVTKLADRVGIMHNGKLLASDEYSVLTADCDIEDAFFKAINESKEGEKA